MLESSVIANCASNGPATAHRSGTNHRLPFRRWRVAKRAAQEKRGTPANARGDDIGRGSPPARERASPRLGDAPERALRDRRAHAA